MVAGNHQPFHNSAVILIKVYLEKDHETVWNSIDDSGSAGSHVMFKRPST
jgi:hypothetical protein